MRYEEEDSVPPIAEIREKLEELRTEMERPSSSTVELDILFKKAVDLQDQAHRAHSERNISEIEVGRLTSKKTLIHSIFQGIKTELTVVLDNIQKMDKAESSTEFYETNVKKILENVEV